MRTMTIDDLRTRLDTFFRNLNEHDPEALLRMCVEGVVWDDPTLPTPVVGWEAVADLLANQLTAFPDMHFPKEEIEIYRSLDGKKAAARWHMVATMTGRLDPPGFEPTGKTGDVTGMTRIEFGDGGRIARVEVLYDTMTLDRRLGLLPGTGSLPFKALVGLQLANALGRRFIGNVRR